MRAGHSSARLAHGWRLVRRAGVGDGIVREFVRPAVRAIPKTMAARLGFCRITLLPRPAGEDVASRWRQSDDGFEIEVATGETEAHDVAIELLLCLGQALWDLASTREGQAYLWLLAAELDAGVTGEIQEEALMEKQQLLSSRMLARSQRRLVQYARASFAATAAEYVHCLWHDVTVRTGPEYLPAIWLRKRLDLMSGWFPPNRGYRLFG